MPRKKPIATIESKLIILPCVIPASGEPVKLVHRIEAGHLDSLPGTKHLYSGWQELFEQVKAMLANHRDIAMQYSPNNLIFYVSLVDGGTLELIRGLGKNVVSSGDLVAQFEATWSEEQIKSHFAARDAIDSITAAAFQEIGRRARNGGTTDHERQHGFMPGFQREKLCRKLFPLGGPSPDGKLIALCVPSSMTPALAITSFIAPDTLSALKFMPTGPTWMISKSTTNAASYRTHVFRSSREFTCPSSACAAK